MQEISHEALVEQRKVVTDPLCPHGADPLRGQRDDGHRLPATGQPGDQRPDPDPAQGLGDRA
jgi:hypothetical protein